MTSVPNHGIASGPAFPKQGISARGLLAFVAQHKDEITEQMTTADVCHTLIKRLTTPAGWDCIAELDNAAKGWYSHAYTNAATGETCDTPPPGTLSLCDLLARQETASPSTADLVGPATVFVSHAWLYRFLDLVHTLSLIHI